MRIPKLNYHTPQKLYYVRLNGKFCYLGGDRAAAEERYGVMIAEWLASGRQQTLPAAGATVAVLAARYLAAANLTAFETKATREAFRPLVRWFGDRPAADFGAAQLAQLQERMGQGGWLTGKALVAALKRGQGRGWCRKEINKAIGRIRRAFRWGVREGLVPATVWAELAAVENLRRGQRVARELPPVLPADEDAIEALLAGPLTAPLLADMVRLSLATGMRPGELVRLRWADVDRDGTLLRRLTGQRLDLGGCWVYLPGLRSEGRRLAQDHKTAHHGHWRIVPLSPAARAILDRYADTPPDEPIFTPRECRQQYYALLRARRRSPVQPSQQSRARPGARKPGRAYTVGGYSQSVRDALRRLNDGRRQQGLPPVEMFAVGQLRHNAATRLVEVFGWDVARLVLGHSTVSTTRIYAADNLGRVFAALSGEPRQEGEKNP